MAEHPFVGTGDGGDDAEQVQARLQRLVTEHSRSMEDVEAFGLVDSPIGPGFVSEWHSSDRAQRRELSLMYGQPRSPTGPLVVVTTGSVLRGFDHRASVTALMDDRLDDEHDRVRDHAGVDERCAPTDAQPSSMTIQGALVDGHHMDDGALWAFVADLELGQNADVRRWLSVVSRGVPVEQVTLERIDDLAKYWIRREEWLQRMMASHSTKPAARQAEPSLPGLDAYRELLAATIEDIGPLLEATRAGRPVHRTARTRRIAWETAVDVQRRLCDQTRSQAYEAVSSLVNQLTMLAQQVRWTTDDVAWAAAVEETIGYVVFDAAVASRPAQLAWAEHRAASRFPSVAELVDRLEEGGVHGARVLQLRQIWLNAWEDWYRNRSA